MSKEMICFAGVSRKDGELKFRTAADDKRSTQLTKLGDTEVEMIAIDPVATKQEAAQALLTRGFVNGRAEVLALLNRVADKTAAPRAKKTVRVSAKKTRVKAAEPTLSIEEANARAVASMREVTEAEALERLCHRVTKSRKRKTTIAE